MGIRLLTNSALRGATTGAGTLAVTSGAALAQFLNDRDSVQQWVAAATSPQNITVDTQVAVTSPLVAALALIHHNLTGTRVGVIGSPDGTTYTPVADVLVNADPFIVSVPTTSFRYWRVQIPAAGQANPSAAARIGEVMLGVPFDIADNPNLPSGKPGIVGNVVRDRSPAGYPWATRKGNPRRRYELKWNALPDSDLAALQHAYNECDEGAVPLVLVDQLVTALWVTWEDSVLPQPGALGVHLQEMTAIFEEVPQ